MAIEQGPRRMDTEKSLDVPRGESLRPAETTGIAGLSSAGDIYTHGKEPRVEYNPLDFDQLHPNPDLVEFDACPENERERYIGRMKRFVPKSNYEKDYQFIGGLYPHHQSTLLQVKAADRLTHTDTYLERGLQVLEKSSVSHIIAAELGHRPPAISFDPSSTDGSLPEDVVAMVENAGAVYLKRDKSAKGDQVLRITKTDDGYAVKGPDSEVVVPTLDEFSLPTPKGMDGTSWIAEEEIPIARTEDGNTWEVRFLQPSSTNFAKVGNADNHVNNVAKGGTAASSYQTVLSVIRANAPGIDSADAAEKASQFLREGRSLAGQVKAITDRLQVELAKQIVTPDDMKDPDQYDAVMQGAFSGNFYCVDITGVWNTETNTLDPMIIEAQPEAGLPDHMVPDAYRECIDTNNRRRALLQGALK
jgi:hypothetical protein